MTKCFTDYKICINSGLITKDADMTVESLRNYLENILVNWKSHFSPWQTESRNEILIELFDRIEALNALM